jgi:hypothetical protein
MPWQKPGHNNGREIVIVGAARIRLVILGAFLRILALLTWAQLLPRKPLKGQALSRKKLRKL